MGSIAERLAKQQLGSIGVAKRRQQEIDGGTLGIDGPIQVAPATLHAHVGFVDSPRLVCRLEMLSQSLLQLRAVILHPAPDRCVIDIETALLQQFLNIAQRKRIAKIPPDRTKYEAGFGLPPFEDRGSGSHFAILSRRQPAALKVATHPRELLRKRQPRIWHFPKGFGAACAGSASVRRPMAARKTPWLQARSEEQTSE